MSDYRPVMRSASGNRHIWLLLHVITGKMLATGRYTRIFASKGEAIQAGEEATARHLNHDGLTSKQIAKVARRTAEAVERDKAFVPHQAPPAPAPTPPIPQPKAKQKAAGKTAAAKPAGTSRPGRGKGTSTKGKVKAKGTSARKRGG